MRLPTQFYYSVAIFPEDAAKVSGRIGVDGVPIVLLRMNTFTFYELSILNSKFAISA